MVSSPEEPNDRFSFRRCFLDGRVAGVRGVASHYQGHSLGVLTKLLRLTVTFFFGSSECFDCTSSYYIEVLRT